MFWEKGNLRDHYLAYRFNSIEQAEIAQNTIIHVFTERGQLTDYFLGSWGILVEGAPHVLIVGEEPISSDLKELFDQICDEGVLTRVPELLVVSLAYQNYFKVAGGEIVIELGIQDFYY